MKAGAGAGAKRATLAHQGLAEEARRELRNAVERLLQKALARASQNKSQAAKLLGLSRGQFYSLLRRHGLSEAKR